MTHHPDRRDFLRTLTTAALTATTAGLALSHRSSAAQKKSLLVFTKSSGFEHEVVKRKDGKLSIAETVITDLGEKNGFEVTCSKDGRIFDSKDFQAHQAVFFFTTGDLTQSGTDKNPPMSPAGKQALLSSIEQGRGFVGSHPASNTFHTPPDPSYLSNRSYHPAPPSHLYHRYL